MQLRLQTRADHEAVDTEFSRFALDAPTGYRDFLMAHARVLPLAERLIRPGDLIGNWEGRTPALLADIAGLHGSIPEDIDLDLPRGEAARWGALYVMEGSRLGGSVLAKRVPDGMPCAYLRARHPSGVWSRILSSLDQADEGEQWREQAVLGAKAVFGAFLTAAKASQNDSAALDRGWLKV